MEEDGKMAKKTKFDDLKPGRVIRKKGEQVRLKNGGTATKLYQTFVDSNGNVAKDPKTGEPIMLEIRQS